jgi:hypothetical protein
VLADVQGAKVAGVHARHPALDMSEDPFFDVVLFLLSEQSRMITMREIPVNGGSLLGM